MNGRGTARLSAAAMLLAALAACGPAGRLPPAAPPAASPLALPAMKTFARRPAPPPTRSNASIAREFLALSFQLESGRPLPLFTRFEGPITLRLTGRPVGRVTEKDLRDLLARLRDEAGIAITRVPADRPANITVEVLSRHDLARAVPTAACFVAPNVQSWAEFKRLRNSPKLDWAGVRERRKMAIFLPGDAGPQELRDCLHEEIAQALGPVNDLYRLDDSIFNDDNFLVVLTGFDMTVLRAYYDPALHNGMSADEVAARLPAILARINPGGRQGRASPPAPTPKAWKKAIAAALGARNSGIDRLAAARKAVSIARASGMHDHRLGFSLYAQGRLALGHDTALALASFLEARSIFAANPDTRVHAAHVAVQMAAYQLSSGHPAKAVAIVDAHSKTALAAQNARLLSSLLMIKAQALDALGRHREARLVRLDSLGWARYGFGSETEIRRRLREVAALVRPQLRIAAR